MARVGGASHTQGCRVCLSHFSLATSPHTAPPFLRSPPLLCSDPGLLRRDGFSGDYGPGLYGYWRSAASYLTCMPPYGWTCALCDVHETEPPVGSALTPPSPGVDRSHTEAGCNAHATLRVTPRDALRRRVYLSPLGLTITVEAAALVEVSVTPAQLSATLTLAPHSAAPSAEATLFIEAERIEPPPPLDASGYLLRCVDAAGEPVQACVKQLADAPSPTRATAEYVVTMRGGALGEPTRLSLQPHG